jgi:hypothetical protein
VSGYPKKVVLRSICGKKQRSLNKAFYLRPAHPGLSKGPTKNNFPFWDADPSRLAALLVGHI